MSTPQLYDLSEQDPTEGLEERQREQLKDRPFIQTRIQRALYILGNPQSLAYMALATGKSQETLRFKLVRLLDPNYEDTEEAEKRDIEIMNTPR
jgi:hypothetical protein